MAVKLRRKVNAASLARFAAKAKWKAAVERYSDAVSAKDAFVRRQSDNKESLAMLQKELAVSDVAEEGAVRNLDRATHNFNKVYRKRKSGLKGSLRLALAGRAVRERLRRRSSPKLVHDGSVHKNSAGRVSLRKKSVKFEV